MNRTHFSRRAASCRRFPTAAYVESLEGRTLLSAYVVTTLGDGAGSVTPAGSGRYNATTLRAALNAANAHAGSDRIQFAAGLTGTVKLLNELPEVSDRLTLMGPGASKLKLDAKDAFDLSVLRVKAGVTAYFSGLTITGGDGDESGYDPLGGGIRNAGTLTVADCVITGNTAYVYVTDGEVYGAGGGVYNTGTMTLLHSVVSHNDASVGGGVHNRGTLVVSDCTFDANSADAGGGISNAAGAKLTVTNTTISNGLAYFGGGGISNGGTLTAGNVTLYGNTAEHGGGLSNYGGTAVLTNCTVTANKADTGGGLHNAAALTLHNSIVAGNRKPASSPTSASDVYAVSGKKLAAASSYNLIGTGGAGGLVTGVNGNKVNVATSALKLGSLASNGGPTKTAALLAGSVAINAGSNAAALNAKLYCDQRGLPRPAGGKVDVGAFEVQAGGGSIAGTVFVDRDRDAVRDPTEVGLGGWQVYVDRNKNGYYDPGEVTTWSASNGTYKLANLPAGTYRIRENRPEGWVRTLPAGNLPLGYHEVTLAAGANVTGKDFGNYVA